MLNILSITFILFVSSYDQSYGFEKTMNKIAEPPEKSNASIFSGGFKDTRVKDTVRQRVA